MIRITTAVTLGLTAIALAACGSSGGRASDTEDTANRQDAARVRLQQCLREHGVDLPGSGSGSTSRPRFSQADAAKLESAMNGPCRELRRAAVGDVTPEQRQEFRDAFATFAACMRKQGVDIPTPGEPGSDGVRARLPRDTPRLRAAMDACRAQLPNAGRGGGPGVLLGAGGAR